MSWIFFKGSAILVELFFVLVGFVMAHSYGFKKDLDFKSFFISRFFRIVPLHWFMFFIVLVLEVGKYLAFKYVGFVFNKVPFAAINHVNFSNHL